MPNSSAYVDAEWQKIRECLATVSSLSLMAAEMANPADAEPLIGLATIQLMDAGFWNGRLLRDTVEIPLEGIDA